MSAAAYYANEIAGGLNPFPGLRPFEPDEDYLFFGRERQTDELLKKLRTTRFLSILGRSGSGKSSLVRSGMIPTLYGGGMTHAGSRWRVAIMRPGEDPLGNLAAALSSHHNLGSERVDESLTRAFFETTLRASDRGLVECIQQSRIPSEDHVLVLVDQFEEIFRYKRSRRVVGRDEAVAFVKLLLTARASEVNCYIAVTMRSDFIGDCMEFGRLPEVINEGIYLVPRMTRDELRSAITGPVAVGRATIAPRLVSRLLNDVGEDPDQLPILQHALMRTWERWKEEARPNEPLDLAQYDAIGTLHTALSRHAEECFTELDARGQAIAEKLFKALTDNGTDARGVRRPAPMSEICALTGATVEDVTAVVDTFRKPGRSFLMPPADVPLRPESILDISHESLMRIWERLAVWVNEEARSGQLYLNVASAAQRHEEGVAALWRDPELQLALTWRKETKPTAEWANRYDPSFERAINFLEASRIERDREVREREEQRRRKLRQARVLATIFSALSLIMLALGAYALTQKAKADKAAAEAVGLQHRAEQAQRRAETEKLRSQQEAARADRERLNADLQRTNALRQTQVAVQQSARAESERQRAEVERVKAETNARVASTKKAEAEASRTEALKEKTIAVDARKKAEDAQKETARLSSLADARAAALSVLLRKDNPQSAGLEALWSYQTNRQNGGNAEDPDVFAALRTTRQWLQPDPVVRQASNIRALAVTADGRNAFAAGDDGRILRFDLNHGGNPIVIGSAAGPVRSLALGDGHRMALGTDRGRIELWDLSKPNAPPRVLTAGTGGVSALAFAPTGSALASANLDGTVTLWDSGGNGSGVALPGTNGKRATSIAFSPDGKSLAAGMKGGALLWNVARPAEAPQTFCADLDVRSLAFRPNTSYVACGGGRGEIVLQVFLPGMTRPVPVQPNSLRGHASSVNALSFYGNFLSSASSDGTVRLWDLRHTTDAPIVLRDHQSWVWTVAFTPDGERLVSGGEDRTLRIWPAHTKLVAGELCVALAKKEAANRVQPFWRDACAPDLTGVKE